VQSAAKCFPVGAKPCPGHAKASLLLTSSTKLPDNRGHMQRFGSFVGVVAMLIALLTSPFYHFHDHDDHGEAASLVHAHLFESEDSEHHDADTIEGAHGRHHKRWVEFFVFSGPSPVFDSAIELTDVSPVAPTFERETLAPAAEPNAHGPPNECPSIPRSPPTV
jgi:hypothetical protein